MPQPKKAGRFGGTAAHHNLMMANLATELVRHGRIRTTVAKAKHVQPLAERMITFAKRGDLHSRRRVLRVIRDRDVVHKLFSEVGPAFAERDGGYTRVLKLGPRKGDAAPMALIELVEGVSAGGEGDLGEAPRRRWSLRRRHGTVSAGARERDEREAAAADRGEELDYDDGGELAEAPAAPEPSEPEAAPATREDEDEEGPQVSAADVEARFAAEEGQEEGREPTSEDGTEADEDGEPS